MKEECKNVTSALKLLPAILRQERAASSHTIIGAISAFGVVNVSIRDPGNVKKRKVVGTTKRKAPKGITAGHYI
jgi:phosphate/sulfate permease